MSRAGDINTLFRRFGGNADTYQEIVAGELASAAEQKWPLLGQVRPQGHHEAPASRKGATAVGERKVQAFMQPPDDKFVPQQVQPMAASPEFVPVNQPDASVSAPVQRPLATAPMAVEPAIPLVARTAMGGGAAAMREPLPTLFGRAAAASAVHVADVPPPHPTAPVRVASPVVVPPVAVSEAVGVRAQAVHVSQPDESAETDLQAIFTRLVPPKVEPPVVPSVVPLKRLVKW